MNFLECDGTGWLWYPGNGQGVFEEFKLDRVAGRDAICWRHPTNSRNPVTGRKGGPFACEDLSFARKTIIAVLPGDPYNLASGQVPFRRPKCDAPQGFKFDRSRFSR